MPTPRLAVLVLALFTLTPLTAHAQFSGYKTQMLANGKAAFELRTGGAVDKVVLKLTPKGGGAERRFDLGTVNGSKTVRFTAGTAKQWTAALEGRVGEQTVTASFPFRLKKAKALKVQVRKRDIQLDKGKMRVISNQPLTDVEIAFFDRGGEEADAVDGEPDSAKKGRVTVTWEPPTLEGPTSQVVARFTDAYGGEFTLELTPFFIEIPHEDVVFASGSAELDAAETPKLDEAIIRVKEVLERLEAAGSRAKPKLYVGGYTDSVGQAGDNKRLSTQRAQVIAGYFVSKVPIPVFFQGFGEKGQAVKTADNVDEPKNRRSAYVLTVKPPRDGAFPGGGWRRLKR